MTKKRGNKLPLFFYFIFIASKRRSLKILDPLLTLVTWGFVAEFCTALKVGMFIAL